MIKVLVVGQTPPPFGGQAIMIQKLLAAPYQKIVLYHTLLAFSKDMDSIGKFQIAKILHLFKVVLTIIYQRFRYGVDILYYPPAGPDRMPMYRDLFILLCTRWLFKKTIFHFHAAGISELYPTLSPLLRILFRAAYFKPDAAIQLSALNPPDGQCLAARAHYIVPNGIEDVYAQYKDTVKPAQQPVTILFTGVLCESKGVLVALEAAHYLREKDIKFHFAFMGKFISDEFKSEVTHQMTTWQLESQVTFLGVLTGDDKWQAYAKADMLCFPTHFESETFGLVILEAMQFSLPVVATQWRGIPSVVHAGESGYLVPIKASRAVADKLELLIQDPERCKLMGQKGRKIYLENYTIDKFYQNLESVFEAVAAPHCSEAIAKQYVATPR